MIRLLCFAALALATGGRRVIIHGVYNSSMINDLSCPIAPIVNRHTLKVANQLAGKDAVDVVVMLDKPLASYCHTLYHRFWIQTLPH